MREEIAPEENDEEGCITTLKFSHLKEDVQQFLLAPTFPTVPTKESKQNMKWNEKVKESPVRIICESWQYLTAGNILFCPVKHVARRMALGDGAVTHHFVEQMNWTPDEANVFAGLLEKTRAREEACARDEA